MIHLTRLDSVPVVVNCDLIESIEATPDTLLSMSTGRKILVKESVVEVIERVLAFKRLVAAGAHLSPSVGEQAPGARGAAEEPANGRRAGAIPVH